MENKYTTQKEIDFIKLTPEEFGIKYPETRVVDAYGNLTSHPGYNDFLLQKLEGNKQEYNKGNFSVKLLEEIFQDLFYKRTTEDRFKNVDWTPVHYVWEDEEGEHSMWKIGIAYTNDAGYEQVNEAVKRDLEK